ncbi:histidine phosphatase family protein [Litoribacter ruber]|uniref:Histidine phosphatase family protein n=1 Tax=Litoribacter ruber TaxID=702568 RepID=A0AAP2G2Y4_9BACT|nr:MULTISPECIES: phosphoglycerate mutase family protein [Litoribacter]MBS9522486.1 histidine phosphatase family protein [Litoribacter alkaliphilus]MBT0811006.1 histidine phosphatase family protein [Litoribacter ruber]
MLRKVLTLLVVFGLFAWLPAFGQAQDNERAIYIIRHGEKLADKDDPALSPEGEQRAERVKALLQDKDIRKVYSSDTKRTRSTIMPFADDKGLGIQLYDTKKHGELVAKLQEETDNVVVIGHSNTIHHLVNLLVGKEMMEELDESDYENIFVVYISDEGATRLDSKKFSDFEG